MEAGVPVLLTQLQQSDTYGFIYRINGALLQLLQTGCDFGNVVCTLTGVQDVGEQCQGVYGKPLNQV
jgi:hypothetical protein